MVRANESETQIPSTEQELDADRYVERREGDDDSESYNLPFTD